MSGNQAITFGAGLVGGVIGFMAGGPVGAMYGFSIAATVAGMILGPDTDQQTIKPDELSVPTSSESATIPVVFGTSRLNGNHIAHDRASFRSQAETQSAGGKGGGGEEQVSGYKYFLTWETGLCMGPVDKVTKIIGSPGQDNVLWKEEQLQVEKTLTITVANDRITGTAGDFTKFEAGMSVFVDRVDTDNDNDMSRGTIQTVSGSGDYIELTPGTFQGADTTESMRVTSETTGDAVDMTAGAQTVTLAGKNKDGGQCTIHPGNTTQTGHTVNGETYNYRHVCYAHFDQFGLGNQPAPRGYLFEIQRMPVCKNSLGSVIAGIKTRASATAGDEEYNDANPAAVLWEMLTNTIWGKGMSADLLNQADFETASVYYETKRIGISTAMAGETGMDSLMQKLRAVFGLAVWWDGEQIKCRVVWDRDNAYDPRTRIGQEDIVGSPKFQRASIVTSVNELRLDFTNRVNNYQSETVTVQDLGAIQELGAVRSEKIQAKEIGTRRAAELLAHRMMRELACQPATLEINVHRTFADRGIGEFVEVYWQAWRSGGGFTSFWRLESIRENEMAENTVTLNLIEDIYATARDGEIANFTAPIISMDVDIPLDDDSFGRIDYTVGLPLGSIEPVLIDEPNIWITKGTRLVAAAIQRDNQSIQTITLGFAEAATLDYQTLNVLRPFAITGTLLDNVSATGPKIIRQTPDQFRIQLTNEDKDAANLLNAASLVADDTEDFSDLTARSQNILIVGNEYLRIGTIEATGTNEYTIRTAMRGELGTTKAAHAISDTVWFIPEFYAQDFLSDAIRIPINTPLKFRLQPFAPNGSGDATIVDGPDSLGLDGSSVKPLAASLKRASRATLDWTIEIRPTLHWAGAGYGPSFETEMLEELVTIDPLRLRIARSDGATVTIADYFASGSLTSGDLTVTRCEWIPGQLGDGESGKIVIELTMTTSNPPSVNIYQRYNGQEGAALNVPQP